MTARRPLSYDTLSEWAADRSDMRIVCACGRTINVPAENILLRFGADGLAVEASAYYE